MLRQIYSENYVLNFIRIARVLYKILQKKTFWSLYFWTQCIVLSASETHLAALTGYCAEMNSISNVVTDDTQQLTL